MIEPCRCNCGYTCGGPGVCKLGIMECLAAGHFVKDCDHDFSGNLVDLAGDGSAGFSVVCSKCGMSALAHDCRCGP
jgi:hypothetical protein